MRGYLVAVWGLAVVGCGAPDDPAEHETTEPAVAALSCEELEQRIEDAAVARMRAMLDPATYQAPLVADAPADYCPFDLEPSTVGHVGVSPVHAAPPAGPSATLEIEERGTVYRIDLAGSSTALAGTRPADGIGALTPLADGRALGVARVPSQVLICNMGASSSGVTCPLEGTGSWDLLLSIVEVGEDGPRIVEQRLLPSGVETLPLAGRPYVASATFSPWKLHDLSLCVPRQLEGDAERDALRALADENEAKLRAYTLDDWLAVGYRRTGEGGWERAVASCDDVRVVGDDADFAVTVVAQVTDGGIIERTFAESGVAMATAAGVFAMFSHPPRDGAMGFDLVRLDETLVPTAARALDGLPIEQTVFATAERGLTFVAYDSNAPRSSGASLVRVPLEEGAIGEPVAHVVRPAAVYSAFSFAGESVAFVDDGDVEIVTTDAAGALTRHIDLRDVGADDAVLFDDDHLLVVDPTSATLLRVDSSGATELGRTEHELAEQVNGGHRGYVERIGPDAIGMIVSLESNHTALEVLRVHDETVASAGVVDHTDLHEAVGIQFGTPRWEMRAFVEDDVVYSISHAGLRASALDAGLSTMASVQFERSQ